MGKGSFAILSKVQDVEVKEQEIIASSDTLNSYLTIPVIITFRLPEPKIVVDFLSCESELYFGADDIICSDLHKIMGYSYFNDSDFRIVFKFNLTKEMICQIEKFRNSDLRFKVRLNFLLVLKKVIELNPTQTLFSSNSTQNQNASVEFEIPKSTWIETLLPKLGYNNIRLIEIPKTHNQLTDEYQKIKKEFDTAEDYFNKKDYNKCISHCRNVLDTLNRNLKKNKNEKPLEPTFGWLKSISQSSYAWIDSVCSATHVLASKTHHPGDYEDFTRQEAESIFLIVLGLINFIAHDSEK